MSEITKCSNDDCPLKGSCYRWLAPEKPEGQVTLKFEPDKNGNCDMYWSEELG